MILRIITTYRRSFATLLLAFFLLSIMPVKVLHSLFANHTDHSSTSKNTSQQTILTAAGIDCHCHANVVTTPFYAAVNTFTPAIPTSWLPSAQIKKQSYTLFIVHHNDLRGPPTLV
jgi:peptidoglycan biosynthesis protein MviN/MurJ (putative lipid II flippase)